LFFIFFIPKIRLKKFYQFCPLEERVIASGTIHGRRTWFSSFTFWFNDKFTVGVLLL
jgi:hypothetical protein